MKLCPVLYPRQDSNLDLKFRKLLFYPLNYGGNLLLDSANKSIRFFRAMQSYGGLPLVCSPRKYHSGKNCRHVFGALPVKNVLYIRLHTYKKYPMRLCYSGNRLPFQKEAFYI